MEELSRRLAMPLGDIRWNRDGSSTHLRGESESFILRKSIRTLVDEHSKLDTSFHASRSLKVVTNTFAPCMDEQSCFVRAVDLAPFHVKAEQSSSRRGGGGR